MFVCIFATGGNQFIKYFIFYSYSTMSSSARPKGFLEFNQSVLRKKKNRLNELVVLQSDMNPSSCSCESGYLIYDTKYIGLWPFRNRTVDQSLSYGSLMCRFLHQNKFTIALCDRAGLQPSRMSTREATGYCSISRPEDSDPDPVTV